MKKITAFLIFIITAFSCYDEYVLDYDFNGVFFPNPVNVRTVVVGEGLKIKVGVELGGVLKNTINREVSFIIDNNLVTSDILTEMKEHTWFWVKEPMSKVQALNPIPSDYFSLSDPNKIIIQKGWHSGSITLTVDSVKFLSDVATINPVYVVPFRITSADADTIVESLSTTIIGLRYEHMLFGNYYHGGITTVKDASGNTISTESYPTRVNQLDKEIMILSTVAPNAVATNGYSKTRTNKQEIMLTLNGNNVIVSSTPGSSMTFESDGACSFNSSRLLQDRKLFLNYKYEKDGFTYHCQDTLTFRNRIRDGINEWQDENPEHY